MEIRKEADRLLNEFGLRKVLEKHGKIHIVGSYRMDMMTYNDLDFNIEMNNNSFEGLYALSSDINALIKPYRFEGYIIKDDNLFYGCETDITSERWNIDIWCKKETDIIQTNEYCDNLNRQFSANPMLKKAMIDIKQELIKLQLYGIDKSPKKHYHSTDIYEAVLNEGILSVEDFIAKYPK